MSSRRDTKILSQSSGAFNGIFPTAETDRHLMENQN